MWCDFKICLYNNRNVDIKFSANTGTKLPIKLQGQNIILYRFKIYVIKQNQNQKSVHITLVTWMKTNIYIVVLMTTSLATSFSNCKFHVHLCNVWFKVCTHETTLTPPLFSEIPVQSQEGDWSCICVLVVSIFFLCSRFLIYFELFPLCVISWVFF